MHTKAKLFTVSADYADFSVLFQEGSTINNKETLRASSKKGTLIGKQIQENVSAISKFSALFTFFYTCLDRKCKQTNKKYKYPYIFSGSTYFKSFLPLVPLMFFSKRKKKRFANAKLKLSHKSPRA